MTRTSPGEAGRTREEVDGIPQIFPARQNGGMTTTRRIDTWLTDRHGALVHEDDPIPGAADVLDGGKPSFVGQLERFPYQPARVVDSIADVVALVPERVGADES